MKYHKQVVVKVNAQVDEGIAPLVEALNACPGVATFCSCQGGKNENAYVAFVVQGEGLPGLYAFVDKLSPALGQNSKISDLPFTLSIEWYAGGNSPAGYLRVPRQHIKVLAE